MVLGTGELVGALGADEVGAPDRPEEHRPAAEHGDGWPVVLAQRVGEMVGGVAGGGQRRHPQVPGRKALAVLGWYPVEVHVVPGGHHVGGVSRLRQRQAAAHVVVVDVGLEHVGDPHPDRASRVDEPADVALRVDHDGHVAVVDEVAAIPQTSGLQGHDLGSRHGAPFGAKGGQLDAKGRQRARERPLGLSCQRRGAVTRRA